MKPPRKLPLYENGLCDKITETARRIMNDMTDIRDKDGLVYIKQGEAIPNSSYERFPVCDLTTKDGEQEYCYRYVGSQRNRPHGPMVNDKLYVSSTTEYVTPEPTYYVAIPRPTEGLTADELREAAHLFNQLAEIMDAEAPPRNDMADAMAMMFEHSFGDVVAIRNENAIEKHCAHYGGAIGKKRCLFDERDWSPDANAKRCALCPEASIDYYRNNPNDILSREIMEDIMSSNLPSVSQEIAAARRRHNDAMFAAWRETQGGYKPDDFAKADGGYIGKKPEITCKCGKVSFDNVTRSTECKECGGAIVLQNDPLPSNEHQRYAPCVTGTMNYRVTYYTEDGPQLYRDCFYRFEAEEQAAAINNAPCAAWAEITELN